MAARKRKTRLDDNTRSRIQAALLINRLHSHVMGEVELTSQQVQSARILLNKSLPDLSTVEIGVDPAKPISFTVVTGVPRDDKDD